ncbi:hypothetical protein K440DRAFT_655242 [Wilcoxina mikolae CBS 423.85]|nr:hypothetical protein K440DRAFT_655242 [Wilcoxina mikolae CBS 423.85]
MASRRKTGSFQKGSMRPPPAPNASRTNTQQPRSQPSQPAPPSSIAAIVQNYSKAGEGPAGLPNKDAFQQLLAEILGPEDSGSFDEDISTNYKVLQVVTSAGLSILFQDDPFAQIDDQLQQASNSLLVIKLTIQRTPAVLFCPPPAENSQPDQLFLYLWLFPRLFPLLGHSKARNLAVELLETIEAMFFAVANLPQYWKHLKTMAGYCRSCLNCEYKLCLAHLQFPPPEFTIDAAILKDLPSFDPRLIRFSLSDVEHGALLGVHIFAILTRIIASRQNIPGFRSIVDNHTSAQHGLSKIWAAMNIWDSLPIMREKTSAICIEILNALDTALLHMATLTHNVKFEGLYLFAVHCAVDTLRRPIDLMNQLAEHSVAGVVLGLMAISGQSPLIRELLKDRLFPPAYSILSNDEHWKLLSHDMQIIMLRLILHATEDQAVIEKAYTTLNTTAGGEWSCKDKKLQKKLKAVLPVEVDNIHGPRKRPRLGPNSGPAELGQSLVAKVYSLLGNQEVTDLAGLSQVAPDGFNKLSEQERCTAVHTLGLLSCAEAGDLNRTRTGGDDVYRCSYCDSDAPILRRKRRYADANDSELLKTLEVLHKLDKFTESPEIRAWGVETLRRMTNHTRDLTHLDLDRSILGMWCISLLQSRRRELRIAAGRTIPSFISFNHDKKVLERNRYIVIDALKILSDSDDSVVQETCVLAWGQFGRISSDHELNIVLLRLVDYLGYPNDLVIGAAWNELDGLVQAHETQSRKLATPFWRSISVTAVKQLQSRPQIVQTLIQFVEMKLPEFLQLTQSYTLPYLVLSGKTDIIQKIAKASRPDCTVQVVCHDNIASILPVLLVQDVPNVEKHTMHLLEAISPEFASSSLTELVRPDSLTIAAELLKTAGETDIHRALNIVAQLSYRPETVSQRKSKGKGINYLANFFETHVLGLCTLFSDTLKNAQGKKTTDLEKIRCLKAIQEMLGLAAESVTSALPQICACAQSALENDYLRTTALNTWAILVLNLQDDNLVPLLGQTFSIILRYWPVYDDEAKNVALEMVSQMFQTRIHMLQESVAMIPSLESIILFSKMEGRLKKWRKGVSPSERLHQLAVRCSHENVIVVEYALVELRKFIKENQDFIHTSAGNQKPDPVVPELIRCLLDVIVAFKDPDLSARPRIERLCAECLGLIGAVNPNIVEATREKEVKTILHNFNSADESAEFAVFFLEKIVVKQFLSATDTKSQGFLAWCAQQLLDFCQQSGQLTPTARRSQSMTEKPSAQKRWEALPPAAREALTPFLKSKYSLSGEVQRTAFKYPLFTRDISYREWLITIITDLLCNPVGQNARQIFDACVRICKGQDISISKFLFPVAVLHRAIGGSDEDRQNITREFLAVLNCTNHRSDDIKSKDTLRQCIETIFSVIDHMTQWLRDKRQNDVDSQTKKASAAKRHYSLEEDGAIDPAIRRVKSILDAIPPHLMAQRSLEFKSYARSLLYWEQHIRQKREKLPESDLEPLYEQLQHIYTHIDEPDGMAGISANLPTLDIEQQILEHRKAGKWTAVQSWYELLLAKKPGDVDVQTNLISSLRDSGQFDALLHQVDGLMSRSSESHTRLLPFAVEASWVSGNWDALDRYLSTSNERTDSTYDIRMGYTLSELRKHNMEAFLKRLDSAREGVTSMMTESATGNIRQCHHFLVQLHALSEVQSISEALQCEEIDLAGLTQTFKSRLNLMGTYSTDKQYILAVRRAALQLSRKGMKDEILSAWLSSAKLARKDDNTQQAYNAVHHATILNPPLATIEHAKLLWHGGQHKNAIRNLNGAIAKKVLEVGTEAPLDTRSTTTTIDSMKIQPTQNLRVAKAKLLLAKWLEASGQTHSQDLLEKFKDASSWFQRWEQGYYYLGRHYNKLYEVEKALHSSKQSQAFLGGEHAKLIVQNYLRALAFGVKYIFQTMPRLLTVWLDLGDEVSNPLDSSYGTEEFRSHIQKEKIKFLKGIHSATEKYIGRLGAWMFFTALPQLMSRITHPHEKVYSEIQNIIVKVMVTYPQQTMWYLMAVTKSTIRERAQRGQRVLMQLKESLPKGRSNMGSVDTKLLINEARKLVDQLLDLCNHNLNGRVAILSLKTNFNFRHEIAPCQLVLPTQAVLTVTLPSPTDALRNHDQHAFVANPPTIRRFHDDVYIMSSLQKPRKINIDGSDGSTYSFLCKPKDDLRKDMRLMEFNSMINRFFKRDPESSCRSLYIRTYSVTPLNEECGIIEWVNNVHTLREILLLYYKQKNILVNYQQVRAILDEACGDPKNPASKKTHIFTDVLLPKHPSVFHEWFLEKFPDPAAWIAARLRYTRTSAVMSMVGTVLGLGDRHGENILFDSKCGDTVHVDFNCLFDKGLGFDKPERVPFRLTHNMVDAFGVTGYEGVYRRACESAMRLLRHNEETMMTVLEAFIHDPSVDMVKKVSLKKVPKAPDLPKPPETPKEILESIQGKLRGLWDNDTVPMSVEGHVEVLIKKATDPENLCAMYIGWCPMF